MTTAGVVRRRLPVGTMLLAAIAVLMLLASGCTSSGSSGGTCEALVRFHARIYTGLGNVDFQAGKRLGTGLVPQCNDTGGAGKHSEPPEPTPTVFAIKGLDPSVAVAAGETRGDAQFYARKTGGDGGAKLPDAVRRYLDSER